MYFKHSFSDWVKYFIRYPHVMLSDICEFH